MKPIMPGWFAVVLLVALVGFSCGRSMGLIVIDTYHQYVHLNCRDLKINVGKNSSIEK